MTLYGSGLYGDGVYGGLEFCTVTYAHITWDATALGASFAAYEIERDDDGTFRQIAEITTEATTTFDDYEGRRGVVATYRMRVRRTDGATSDYTATDTAQPAAPGCDYVFTTNEDPPLTLCYCDRRPRRYEFPRRTQVHPLYNEDYQAAFSELEDRGDVFTVDLVLAGESERPTATPGRETFDAILALARAQLAYVAVLDSDGNRWFAHLDVAEGQRDEPGGLYTVPLRVTELTTTPSTPDA